MGDDMLSEMMSNSPSSGSSGSFDGGGSGGGYGGSFGGGESLSIGSSPSDFGTLQMPNYMQPQGGREMGGFKVQTPESPGPDGSLPAQTPQWGDQFWRAGQNSSNPSPPYLEFSSPYAPVSSPYSTVTGAEAGSSGAYAGGVQRAGAADVSPAAALKADNVNSNASSLNKYDYMPGINLGTVLDLPDVNLPEAGSYKTQLETAAYKLAKGDDVTNAHDREAFEGTIANQDSKGMKFLETEFNKIFEQAKWPVSVKMTEPAKDAADQNAKIDLTKLDPATNKPTGETYTISIDVSKLQQK